MYTVYMFDHFFGRQNKMKKKININVSFIPLIVVTCHYYTINIVENIQSAYT